LVLSLLCLFLFGIFEYARYLMVTQLLANAARDGARYAATNVDKTNAFLTNNEGGRTNITDYVKNECRSADKMISNFAVAVYPCDETTTGMYADPPVIKPKVGYTSWNQASFTGRIAVQITGDYKPVLPVVWLPGSGSGLVVSFYGSGTVPIKIVAACGSEG
jgi:Flp pilus assembly protein TadG